MGKLKSTELRAMNKTQLTEKLDNLKTELWNLRVSKVASSSQSKLTKIKTVRKDIARVLTVINQKRKTALFNQYKHDKYRPLDLRPKLTRAMRRRLTPKQAHKKTLKLQKRLRHFPKRKFALKQPITN
ncbi:hypothetical protein M0811_09599 [Anaeramoeba ignava]|uniref:60S ribosomal protein L35 n=1 Tax=Anaeramoeba ignava TaxID=1746090 RepID=A0A9Q0R9M6_ANAIG|nr:hypothetical protein M0811_09599 [Anaeramoeba ignava]|eukprot:Anaeramoba_ignava/a227624_398.p1 GENE.a227624_398~~a227624_398.p1  ORF type:complete len:141 (-),score=34.30 a227624_398:139-522(-)